MSELPANLDRLLQQAMLRDEFRLKRKAQDIRLREKQGKPVDQMITRWQQEWETSRTLAQKRADMVPGEIEFPENLPVSGKREEIARLIRDHQVVVLAGETGSGKTTQLPKICLQLGLGVRGMIGHTQPRPYCGANGCRAGGRRAGFLPRRAGRLPGSLYRASQRYLAD